MDPEETTEVTTENAEVTTEPQVQETEVEDSNKVHPGWNELLEAVPSSLHPIVTPYLTQRDKTYQDGIDKVHSQYANYKQFADAQVDPGQINYALQVIQAINERPADTIRALQEWAAQQGIELTPAEAKQVAEAAKEPGQVENEIPEELFTHPKFVEMEKMVQTQAQFLVQQEQAKREQAEDEKLTKELTDLKASKGEFDERWVLTYAMANNGATLEQAVDAYNESINSAVAAKQRPAAPKLLGNGGGAPGNQMTREDMKDPKNRKSVVAQMLQQASQSD